MIKLSLNGVDYSKYVYEKNYSVNQADVYGNTEWTDANYVKHKSVVRKVISGTIILTFLSEAEFNGFVSSVEEKVQGYNLITVYVNNINEEKTINAYLTTETKVVFKTDGEFGIASVNLTIEER